MDPSVVFHDGMYHMFATVNDTSFRTFNMVYLSFADWEEAGTAEQFFLGQVSGLAGLNRVPQVFYFAPDELWYLLSQAPAPRYSTTSDLSDPGSWSPTVKFMGDTEPQVVVDHGGDWTDFWVICDDENCFMFFTNHAGELFRSQTRIDLFPNGFNTPVVVMSEASASSLWAAVEVHKIEGSEHYLMIIAAQGATGRYLRAWISDRLDGDWTPYAGTAENPFAGTSNVTFVEEAWTDDFSHGEFVRHNVDQTMTIDLCGDLEFV